MDSDSPAIIREHSVTCPACHRVYDKLKPTDCKHVFHSLPYFTNGTRETWIPACGRCGGTNLLLAPKSKPELPAVLYCTECKHMHRLYEIEWKRL